MWDNYYDTVEYKEKTDRIDAAGNIIYLPTRNINVRNVSGGADYIIKKDSTTVRYNKEYQLPFMVKEGDKINNRLVLYVEPSKDVFGNFHFCIAKVE